MPQVFHAVEAASPLFFIFEGSVPVTGLLRLPVVREEQLGKPSVWSNPDSPLRDLDPPVDLRVLVHERVKVPERDEGTDFEADRPLIPIVPLIAPAP